MCGLPTEATGDGDAQGGRPVRVTEHGLRVLVALAAAERSGERPTIARMCHALQIADSTVYAWVGRFVAYGLVERGAGFEHRVTERGWHWLQSDTLQMEAA